MKRKEKPHQKWLRCARFVVSQYEKANSENPDREPKSYQENGSRLDQQALRMSLAKSRRWKVAEAKAREDYYRELRKLRDCLEAELSKDVEPAGLVANETDLFRDILALAEEFAEVNFDIKAKRLSVYTKDIMLEDIMLGAFEIEIHLDTLSADRPYYQVIAAAANRASSNDSVTHPHVQDDRLCEGEAQPAIKLALQHGRLLDFFQLVEHVLGTYNPSSAYVTIRDWEGMTCGHCGHSADSDECRECAGCEAVICDECVYRCNDCEDSFCGNCDEPCSGCLESVCKSCIRTCDECDERNCSDCLSENERCTTCEEKANEESKTRDTETEVHAERVGETTVPA
ncbi:MAG: hypothetical protein R3C03_04345 [Pirellulaceae bacterium]